jgi:hypothetical protein
MMAVEFKKKREIKIKLIKSNKKKEEKNDAQDGYIFSPNLENSRIIINI